MPQIEDPINKIKQAIEQGKPVIIRLYALLGKTEEELNTVITGILLKYNRTDLLGTVYTAVKELAMNGAKANIKRILFQERGIDIDNEEEYEKGMKSFKQILTEEFINTYAQKASEKNLYVDVRFDYNQDRLIVEVTNNSPLSPKEDARIREKFKYSLKYESIADFYMEMADNTEGAGMGITLIMMLLKAEGIDPHMFTIRSDYKTKTVAKLEIPLSPDYKTSRERFEQGVSL